MLTGHVSVIVPTRNRARYLPEALASVFGQTLQEFELIVVDDGSTDETPDLLGRVADSRLRVIRQSHRGTAAALNAGLAAARAPYVARLDDDDVWLADLLATQIGVLEERPDVSLIYARCQLMAADGAPRPGTHGAPLRDPRDPFASLLYGDCTTSITSVYRRRTLEELCGWNETMVASEDWDLALRVARHHGVAFVDRLLARVRRHPDNTIRLTSPIFDARLADRERVLDRVFDSGDLPPTAAALRPIAYRNLHTGAALQLVGLGRFGDARRQLARAFAIGGNRLATAGRIGWSFFLWYGLGRSRSGSELARRVLTRLRTEATAQ